MTFNFEDIMIGNDDDMDGFAPQMNLSNGSNVHTLSDYQEAAGNNNAAAAQNAADTLTSLHGVHEQQQQFNNNDDGGDEDDDDDNQVGGAEGNGFEIPERFTMNGRKKAVSFPLKLMKVLSMKEYQHIVSWLPDGKQFHIVDRDQFTKTVLSEHFKQAKYSSFTRKLFRWGFERVGHLRGKRHSTFCHPLFHKDRVDLVDQMTHSILNHTNQLPPALMGSGNCGRFEPAMFADASHQPGSMIMGGGGGPAMHPHHQQQQPPPTMAGYPGMMMPTPGGMSAADMHMAHQQQQQQMAAAAAARSAAAAGGHQMSHPNSVTSNLQQQRSSQVPQQGATATATTTGSEMDMMGQSSSASSHLEQLIEIEVRKRLLKDKLNNANMYKSALSNVEQQIQELSNDPMLQNFDAASQMGGGGGAPGGGSTGAPQFPTSAPSLPPFNTTAGNNNNNSNAALLAAQQQQQQQLGGGGQQHHHFGNQMSQQLPPNYCPPGGTASDGFCHNHMNMNDGSSTNFNQDDFHMNMQQMQQLQQQMAAQQQQQHPGEPSYMDH